MSGAVLRLLLSSLPAVHRATVFPLFGFVVGSLARSLRSLRPQEERSLTGHGWDVKSVEWHPFYSLVASGSKDNLVKLWDPRKGSSITTLYGAPPPPPPPPPPSRPRAALVATHRPNEQRSPRPRAAAVSTIILVVRTHPPAPSRAARDSTSPPRVDLDHRHHTSRRIARSQATSTR